jgi:hypothetical protein
MTTKRKPTTTNSDDELVAVGAKIPRGVKRRIQEIAKSEDRVYQRVVARVLRDYVDSRKGAQAT